ncbi:hypothetical protein C8R42DRAFT_262992 [Lentinula raphanica]|nr:hypothetical protein C8R42DRAFT_262992 [Lentinula raphanica]
MEFTLSDFHPSKSTFYLVTQNGSTEPMFIASMGHGLTGRRHTTIHQVGQGVDANGPSVGDIHLKMLGGDRVVVRGSEMRIVDHGFSWKSIKFIASNGQIYKWKASGTRNFNLETHQGQMIAVFAGGHRHLFSSNEQATLRIYNPRELALEDIITTLVYVTRRREVTKASEAAAG